MVCISEKTVRSVGTQCNLNSKSPLTPEKQGQGGSVKQESSDLNLNKGSLQQSFYEDDDTLDSTKGGQKIVKVADVIDGRRLRYKMQFPEDYNSDDPDVKFRNWSLRTPSSEESAFGQTSYANSRHCQYEPSLEFLSSSLNFIQQKKQEDSSATVSDLECPSPKISKRAEDGSSPDIFSQDFFSN